jgi:putative transcriptional regulator
MMNAEQPILEIVSKRIAGEIVLSTNPGATMRKWRTLFQVNQNEIAAELSLSPSVVSDYETGRRRSPGSIFIRRFVEALLEIDERGGGHHIKQMARTTPDSSEVFLDIREFQSPVTVGEICKILDCELIVGEEALDRNVFGYTIIDSLKAIQTLSGIDFYRIFGMSSERALVFVGVSKGRSPMIAVKISPMKPRVVVLHGEMKDVDPLAVNLARLEGVPLALSRMESREALVGELLKVYKRSTKK